MLSIVKSMALNGIEGYLIEVQTDVTGGLPSFEVVGLPDTSVRESKDRVRAAIKNSGMVFPSKRFLVNLAPANTKKEGTMFDLPIAVAILIATQNINVKIDIEHTVFIGELSLGGKINKTKGILPMCIDALKFGIKTIILPKENSEEAAVVDGIKVIPVSSLKEVVKYLNGEISIQPMVTNKYKYLAENEEKDLDYSDVRGQENVKRALEIAASRRT